MMKFPYLVAPSLLAAALAGTSIAAPPQTMMAPPPIQNPNSPPPSPMVRAPQPIQNPNAPQADMQQGSGSGGEPADQYAVLAITVTTGDDDLRSDSAAWLNLAFPDGTKQMCWLRNYGQDTWSNNTVRGAPPCILPSNMTYDQLKSTRIELAYNGAAGVGDWGTYDNWNVNEVRIDAQNPTQHLDTCLFDTIGYPLVRLTGSLGSFVLSDTPSTC
jgi:hypothetical protein